MCCGISCASLLAAATENGPWHLSHPRADSSGIVSFDKAEVILERTELVNVTVPVPTNATANGTSNATVSGAKGGTSDKPSTDNNPGKAAEAAHAAADAGNATAGGAANGTANGTTAEPEPKTMVVQRERRRTLRIPLKIGGPGFVRPGLSDEQRKVPYDKLHAGCGRKLGTTGSRV